MQCPKIGWFAEAITTGSWTESAVQWPESLLLLRKGPGSVQSCSAHVQITLGKLKIGKRKVVSQDLQAFQIWSENRCNIWSFPAQCSFRRPHCIQFINCKYIYSFSSKNSLTKTIGNGTLTACLKSSQKNSAALFAHTCSTFERIYVFIRSRRVLDEQHQRELSFLQLEKMFPGWQQGCGKNPPGSFVCKALYFHHAARYTLKIFVILSCFLTTFTYDILDSSGWFRVSPQRIIAYINVMLNPLKDTWEWKL